MQLSNLNPDLTRKWMGGLAACAGSGWIWMCVAPPIRGLMEAGAGSQRHVVFLLTTVPMTALPGGLALVWGLRLFRRYSDACVKWLVGTAMGVLVLITSAGIDEWTGGFAPGGAWSWVTLFLLTLLAVPFYLFLVRRVVNAVTGAAPARPTLLGKGILMVLALELWMALFELFRTYAPQGPGEEHLKRQPWQTLSVLAPLALAWVFYRLSVWKLEKARRADS